MTTKNDSSINEEEYLDIDSLKDELFEYINIQLDNSSNKTLNKIIFLFIPILNLLSKEFKLKFSDQEKMVINDLNDIFLKHKDQILEK